MRVKKNCKYYKGQVPCHYHKRYGFTAGIVSGAISRNLTKDARLPTVWI